MIEIPEIVIPRRRRRAIAQDTIVPEGVAHEDVAIPDNFVAPREDEIQVVSPSGRVADAQSDVHSEPDNEPDNDADDPGSMRLSEPMNAAPDFHATETPRLDTGLDRRAQSESMVHEAAQDVDSSAPLEGNSIAKGRADDFVIGARPASMDRGDPEMDEALRDRRRRLAITGSIAGLGAIAESIGAARGMGGLAGLGGALTAGQSFVDPNAPVKELQLERAGEERAREVAEQEEQRALSNEVRERSLALQEQNAESGQTNAEANRRMRELEQQRLGQTFDAEHNPDSPAAMNARQRFAAQVRQYEDAGIGDASDWQDVLDTLPSVGASEIERNIEDVSNSIRTRLRRRGGGGSGRGGGAQADASRLQIYVDEIMRRNPGMSRENAERLATDAFTGENGTARDIAAGMGGFATRSGEFAERHEADESAVPGWDHDPSIRVNSAAVRQARETAAMWSQVRSYIAAIDRARRNVTGLEATAANAGVISQNVASALQAQEQLTAIMREIGHYGVPQPAELARMEALAPRITSLDGLLNAGSKYHALYGALWQRVNPIMQSMGYSLPRRR